MDSLRIGIGYDVHRLVQGRPCIIGGVRIPFDRGLDGHSDADVLVHAIIDALLGAAGLGDIGAHFPDTDERYRGADSLRLLTAVHEMLVARSVAIVNIDSVVQCQMPKILPHAEEMKRAIGRALGGLDMSRIGIKGKTTEGLGFPGRGEGIAAQAVALIMIRA